MVSICIRRVLGCVGDLARAGMTLRADWKIDDNERHRVGAAPREGLAPGSSPHSHMEKDATPYQTKRGGMDGGAFTHGGAVRAPKLTIRVRFTSQLQTCLIIHSVMLHTLDARFEFSDTRITVQRTLHTSGSLLRINSHRHSRPTAKCSPVVFCLCSHCKLPSLDHTKPATTSIFESRSFSSEALNFCC